MKIKILIIGAGIIGCGYAVHFRQSGFDVTLLARSGRLQEIAVKGLLFEERKMLHKADVRVISNLPDRDVYDFIFIAVCYEQVIETLLL